MKARVLLSCMLMMLTLNIFAQDEQWEPQHQIKGYVSTQGEYIDNLKIYERNSGVALSELGLLVNYQPLRQLTFKTTFVYRPGLYFDQMVNDAYGEWKFNDHFSLKTGRFLTPLSPVNLHQYASMNTASVKTLTIN